MQLLNLTLLLSLALTAAAAPTKSIKRDDSSVGETARSACSSWACWYKEKREEDDAPVKVACTSLACWYKEERDSVEKRDGENAPATAACRSLGCWYKNQTVLVVRNGNWNIRGVGRSWRLVVSVVRRTCESLKGAERCQRVFWIP